MAFEQNQQGQFNMNNSLDQVKQFQSELDKANASIGAAELQAEEELLGIKLKNLSKTQQTKLTQLGQMLELEEKSIQELAKLKLTLSNRQFAVRKKEIQKEFQEYKAAADEFFKAESKRKPTNAPSGSKKPTENLKVSNKSADADIQKASKKVQSAIYSVNKVYQEVGEAIASLQDVASNTQSLQKENKKALGSTAKATTPQASTANAAGENKTTAEIKAQEGRQFSDNSNGMEKSGIGEFSFESIVPAIEQLQTAKNTEVSRIVRTLNSVLKTGKENTSQSTVDLAGDLIENANRAEEIIAKVREFNENKAQNMRIVQLAEEQKLAGQHAQTEHDDRMAKIAAYAQKRDLLLNRETYLTEAENKLRNQHITEQNKLTLAAIDAKAKANDLISNKAQYALEARQELENELASKKNSLTEDLIKKEEALKFTAAHRDELLANQKAERENKYLDEYAAHLLEAGDYAVSLEEYKADQERKRKNQAKKEAITGITDGLTKFGSGEFSLTDIKQSYGEFMGQRTAELMEGEDGLDKSSAELSANFELLAEAAGSLADMLDSKVKEISAMQGFIDTRLQGSRENEMYNLSYGKRLLEEVKWIAGVSPYIKQEKLVENIKALVDKGISFDIKQRAFLMTIQEKIANTFDVADGTLLRLIRIQQQDTTAGRLGMESALNSFLNSMYETSEYLESVAGQVRGSLEEMQALMEGKAATEIEYQVQKWMGSLYSVGMSDSVVQDIAKTFGQVASGDIGGISNGGTGNLLIMAANEAGMSIADILQDGLNADETNKLMQAMVNYLAEIAETSSDSKVVQQQLANVYGLKASDLRAATNLATSLKDVSKADMSYSGMMGQLNLMMNTIGLRTSVGEAMTNMWDNVMYSMASTQASNPILYLLPKMADLLRDVTGGNGITLPGISVMGNMVELHTSVADLMSVASMAGTALGVLGPALVGLTDLVNPLAGSTMLMRAGINPFGKVPVIARGSAPVLQTLGGSSVSESGFVGNASGDDIKNATLQGAEDDKKNQMVEAKEDETDSDLQTKSQQATIDIYNLLEEIVHGSLSLRVRLVTSNNGFFETDNGNWVLSI